MSNLVPNQVKGDSVQSNAEPGRNFASSMLTSKHDPFAKRQGRHLRWKDVSMTVPVPSTSAATGDSSSTSHPDNEDKDNSSHDNVDMAPTIGNNGTGHDKNGPYRKTILDRVWGEVPAGETTAILGPSGSGKTSLLNILSGRVTSSRHRNRTPNRNDEEGNRHDHQGIQVHVGDVRLNNYRVDPSHMQVRRSIAFVAQDDSLQATATVREAILFSAKLRLPKSVTDEALRALVQRMINELGLAHCADTLIGGPLVKGVSGGERKRASVGVELVTQPRLICLDEPTSGLDSYSALQLCKVLKKVAAAGSSVLFTIHQPSSEIFKTFDHVLLLKTGRVLYAGGVAQLPEYFAQRGYAVPEQYNPADWIMHVAQAYSVEELQGAGFFPAPPSEWGDTPPSDPTGRDVLGNSLHDGQSEDELRRQRLGWPGQTRILLAREIVNFRRNKHALKARTAMTVVISLFAGVIFYDVAETSCDVFINIQSTFGALLMSLLANVFSTTLPSLLVFPQERPVFLREYSTDHYSVLAYFLSRLAIELIVTAIQVTVSVLITYYMVGFDGSFGILYATVYLLAMASTALGVLLGSSAEDPSTAMELLPGIIMPQILFAGFFVPPELIPGWLAWIRYICPLTYAVRIALVNEFDGGRCDGPPPSYPQTVLSNVGADPDETWWYWIVLAGMFVVLRILALLNLRRKARKFY